MTKKNVPATKKLHNWKVVAMADHMGGPNLYKCSKCGKQDLVPKEPSKEGCR